MKKSDDYKAILSKLQDEAKTLLADENSTKEILDAKTKEISDIKSKIELQEKVEEDDEVEVKAKIVNSKKEVKTMDIKNIIAKVNAKEVLAEEEKEEFNKAYTRAFCNAFRKKETQDDIEILNTLSEGTGANGGLVVPQDVQTRINEYKRSLPQLETLINIIPVSTLSGSRVFEAIATMTPFTNVTDDTADIEDMGNPTFENVTYAIKDYAGYLPIPNDLLQDSDQAILDYLVGWIGKKSVVTRNSLILAILNTLPVKTFADWKAIKKAINITLDPIFAANAKIITNQDGYQYLDTLVDKNDRPLLQPDVSNPGGNVLFGKPVVVIPNGTLPTTGDTTKLAPMFIGDLKEAIVMFERQGYQIASTNIGGTAFRKNRTEMRVIEREDIKKIDATAVVFGQVDVTSVIA